MSAWRWLPMVVLLLGTGPAAAGLYNTSEPTESLLDPTYLERFHNHLLVLRSLGMDKIEYDNPMRRRYVLQAELAGRGVPRDLTVEQSINLSTVLMRRRRPDEAVALLRPLAAVHRDHFLLQANLATAYQLSGQVERARAALEQALAAMPSSWEKLPPEKQKELVQLGWEENIYRHFRDAEKHHLKLLMLRERESRLRDSGDKLDDLFGVKYMGESGAWAVGAMDPAEKKKLPYNAVDIVEQLVSWMPYDDRLYWQLGELMNAQGNVKAARIIFDQLVVDRQYRAEEVRERRRKLLDTPIADESGTSALSGDIFAPSPTKLDDSPPLVWRPLLVSFGIGVLAAIFAQWQIRELRRRLRG